MFLQEKYDSTPNLKRWFTPRGGIYTCHLGENVGGEKNGIGRPVLVVSSDRTNRSNDSILVVSLTTKIKWQDEVNKKLKYDTHYVLWKKDFPKLDENSAVLCEEIRLVSKARLGDFICQIDKPFMNQIKKRLKNALQI
jgi:mRNA interferase MazF